MRRDATFIWQGGGELADTGARVIEHRHHEEQPLVADTRQLLDVPHCADPSAERLLQAFDHAWHRRCGMVFFSAQQPHHESFI